MANGTTDLFGMSFIGKGVMETAWRVKILWKKNLLIIYLFCRTEKRLPANHKN